MNLDQATRRRLSEIAEVWEMGLTEHTGRAMRTSQEEGGEAIGKRFAGLKPSYPELYDLKEGPKAIAAAIREGEGPAYERVYETVERSMLREGFEPARKRGRGRLTIPPHEPIRRCKLCREYHAPGEHRFHGKGAFHRTHLFSFGSNPMTLAEAKATFRDLMAKAREGRLTERDRATLRSASQIIRYSSRRTAKHNNPAGSKPPGRRITFGHLSRGAVFEFFEQGMPAGPWRKVGDTSFQLAAGGKSYTVDRKARVRHIEPGLFSAGPLFEGNPRRRRPIAARRPTPRARRNAPTPQRGDRFIRMGPIVEVRYKRDWGKKPGFYKHKFGAQRATLYYDSKLDIVIFE